MSNENIHSFFFTHGVIARAFIDGHIDTASRNANNGKVENKTNQPCQLPEQMESKKSIESELQMV